MPRSPRLTASRALALAAVALAAIAACATEPDAAPPSAVAPQPPPIAAPLTNINNAYALAGNVVLPARKGADSPGIHNLFQLSNELWSGSEPEGEEAFQKIESLGVKTIVSVDGKAPDVALAAKHGLRYVHIPIEYKGLSDLEIAELAKTYRECEGPFYTHCFHGKHRGPAANAVGRLVLDGATREQAIAEMRQWCGTAPEYEGLFRDVAMKPMPTAEATRALAFTFPSARTFGDFREAMIDISRRHDALKKLEQRDFAVDPDHPDWDALNESDMILNTLDLVRGLPETATRPAEFQQWMAKAVEQSRDLRDALKRAKLGEAAGAEAGRKAFATLNKTCNDCHAAYRNQ
jgi:protein tyrosine phosphatase (PTP) superfamily phosphohydrolase (DUF442 family)